MPLPLGFGAPAFVGVGDIIVNDETVAESKVNEGGTVLEFTDGLL